MLLLVALDHTISCHISDRVPGFLYDDWFKCVGACSLEGVKGHDGIFKSFWVVDFVYYVGIRVDMLFVRNIICIGVIFEVCFSISSRVSSAFSVRVLLDL